ncbi:MAG: nitric oxide reductase activation protein NorD [Pyrinomonadaceae bacterium]
MASSEEQNGERSLTGLAKGLSRLSADKRRAALETSAAIAGVSLRASREFVEAVPRAARILSADDLRAWGELGRRLAMGSVDTAAGYFAAGAAGLRAVPQDARGFVFQITTRQLVLSSSIALDTFYFVPELAKQVGDERLLSEVLRLAAEIASRSARHSSDLLRRTPAVASVLEAIDRDDAARGEAIESVFALAFQFANRTGGMTADLWASLPEALAGLGAEDVLRLTRRAAEFLEFGGSVTLHFISAGGGVLLNSAAAFDKWADVSRQIGRSGNAVLIAFLRAAPQFFAQISRADAARGKSAERSPERVLKVLELIDTIARSDAESALAAFRSSASALRSVSIEQFEDWVSEGLSRGRAGDTPKARRSYFALETRGSNDRLQETRAGLQLERVQNVLRIYIEGLTGKEVEIAPLTAMVHESRIGDGRTIYLPASVAEFTDDDVNFRLYKVLAAHGAGQIEFGTFQTDTRELKAAYAELTELYGATAEQLDAFSLAGYIEDVQKGERALGDAELREELRRRRKMLPKDSDYKAVLRAFPEYRLARRIFGTMENARIDRRLRSTYRGLRVDLDLMQRFLRESRPYIFDLPVHQVPFELLFQITLCGGATDDARQFYGQVVSEIETVVESYLAMTDATVADSIMATSRVYNLFQNITPEQTQEAESDEQQEEKGEFAYEDKDAVEAVTEDQVKREQQQRSQDIRDLFSAWNEMDSDDDSEPDDLSGPEAWSHAEMPEQPLEPGDEAFAYDEWDRELNDYRVGWSRVIEKKVRQGDRNFVELTRSRYRGVINSIRHQFQLMKPENLTKVNREIDGEDYDLNALVEFVIDRKADGRQSENIYTKRLRKHRDVAVSILLDQSSSTARTITRNPLQPYTYPGRRIIEIEKEGLVLMSEALEAVGDRYSINGFTSEGRRNVKFYVVKDFDEKYTDDVERRIGGITFQNNTRLGAAIRHAAAKLLKQESRTKLLIILTDGRPYDHDYGDARYAREDVREALLEAKTHGITPFCVTIDRESESELKDLYGDVGYTIIDDVLSLPERMPNIYRRLTS